jgi:flagellar hook-length control protein FliK
MEMSMILPVQQPPTGAASAPQNSAKKAVPAAKTDSKSFEKTLDSVAKKQADQGQDSETNVDTQPETVAPVPLSVPLLLIPVFPITTEQSAAEVLGEDGAIPAVGLTNVSEKGTAVQQMMLQNSITDAAAVEVPQSSQVTSQQAALPESTATKSSTEPKLMADVATPVIKQTDVVPGQTSESVDVKNPGLDSKAQPEQTKPWIMGITTNAAVQSEAMVEQPTALNQAAKEQHVELETTTLSQIIPVAAKASEPQTSETDAEVSPSPASVTVPVLGKIEADLPVELETKPQQPLQEQVMQQIVQKARVMVQGNQQTMQMQLKPEHLGQLNLQIVVDNGVVTAKFQAENPQVKHMLEASMHQLKQDLQAQGLKVQQVDVYVGQHGMSFSDFSRRNPNFTLVKSKKVGQVDGEEAEKQFTNERIVADAYQGRTTSGVDYKV